MRSNILQDLGMDLSPPPSPQQALDKHWQEESFVVFKTDPRPF